jgi:hypothetical protein
MPSTHAEKANELVIDRAFGEDIARIAVQSPVEYRALPLSDKAAAFAA